MILKHRFLQIETTLQPKTGQQSIELLPACAPPQLERSSHYHQLTLIYTISRKTRFKESIFKMTMTQKTTFPLVWEISFSAISKVKLKLDCILSQEIVRL